jgi:hypothetical protein
VNRLRALRGVRIRRVTWPWPALEIVLPDGRGWLLMPLTTDFHPENKR